ncbi:type II toxin-antitoxin system RelE/ParE family toxin [Yinghuangia sp. ASG 101]|uniref:type II toxin-antitoxin system RelE/ParE family toxin n=1 Tax=Yinghuangia sp. ASG 101 TaxID=2896848 RepID=UPI001E4E396E|nr:type II toxin-antitoxin system RelE/ParE family toxin [Yinghuangia sp. ASG 101]UGQ09075.1 type II toxin-antitoxin system RelE/ParE family toxin [Yinghuangia sp. ASG 101]
MHEKLYAVEMEPEVASWLTGLSEFEFGQVDSVLGRLLAAPTTAGMPLARSLGDGLWELRFYLGRRQTRITYWITSDRRIILLTTFFKTRMNERHEVDRAKRLLNDCRAGAPGHDGEAEHVFKRGSAARKRAKDTSEDD